MVQELLCGFTVLAIRNRLTGAKWRPNISMPATSVPTAPLDLPLLTTLIFPRCNCRPTGTRDCSCWPALHHLKTAATVPIIFRGSFFIPQQVSRRSHPDENAGLAQVRRTPGIHH